MTTTAAEPWTTARHPLARLLRSVVAGSPPDADGGWTRVSPWIPTVQAVVAFTGHTIVAVSYDITDAQLVDLGVDGAGGALSPRVFATLAGPTGWIGAPQLLFAALGTGAGQHTELASRSYLARHPYVEASRRSHQDLQILGAGEGDAVDLVVLSRGVAGVREVGVYVHPAGRGRGRGATLARAALDAVPENEVTLASSTLGDAAALRALTSAGFTPIGAVQMFSNRPEHKL